MMKKITGWHVFGAFALAFGIIISVNLTLAFQAVRTFPGLEVKNSYVASQTFDVQRNAQEALAWDVAATLENDQLRLEISQDGIPVQPRITKAVFGRATHVGEDQQPVFAFDGRAFLADVQGGGGNWNLRLTAQAEDGTLFQQRIIVRVVS
ncbi:FixH family protein [Phaeobacter sp. J2-8]|uniref:FixH family protein n=1 Tax=Phaeobacter sp. J2-8 TaxID=2931394 RepID=UPI0032AEC580